MNDPDRVDREIAVPWRRSAPGLDELHRARLVSEIEAGLDGIDAGRGQFAPLRRRVRLGLAVVAIAGAAASIAVAVRTRPRGPGQERPTWLAPYLYSGPGADARALEPSATLVVPAGGRARAAIGTRARLTLVGPGRVSLASTAGDPDLDLTLESGRLLVDYDGHGGGTLRVRSPGAVTTVVGTLFSIEAMQTHTRVAVTRGHIRTEAVGRLWQVAAGDCWATGENAVGPIPPELRQALAEHDASPAPPVGEYGILHVGAEAAAGGTSRPATAVLLDRRALGTPPLVARIAAGHHLLDAPTGQTNVELAGGGAVRIGSSAGAAPSHDATPPPPDPSRRHRIAAASGRDRPEGDIAHQAPGIGRASPDAAALASHPEDLDAAYAVAEARMRAGARDEARLALEDIAARDPHGRLGEAALLDLARVALADGNAGDAHRALARLPDPPRDPALSEPADHLRCRTELLLGNTEAAHRCLTELHRRYRDPPGRDR
jgi:hypothetical protein